MLKPDDLITVRVSHVFSDGGLKVEFVGLIAHGPEDKVCPDFFLNFE